MGREPSAVQGWRAKLFGNLDRKAKPKPVCFLHSYLVNALKTSEHLQLKQIFFCLFVWMCCNILLVSFCSVCGISTLGLCWTLGEAAWSYSVTLIHSNKWFLHQPLTARYQALTSERVWGCPDHPCVPVIVTRWSQVGSAVATKEFCLLGASSADSRKCPQSSTCRLWSCG